MIKDKIISMSTYIERSKKYSDKNYDQNKCYCGNKFLKFKVPKFNKSCHQHDYDYDCITGLEYKKEVKLLADKRFYSRNKEIANKQGKYKKYFFLFLAALGYAIVRALPDNYIK